MTFTRNLQVQFKLSKTFKNFYSMQLHKSNVSRAFYFLRNNYDCISLDRDHKIPYYTFICLLQIIKKLTIFLIQEALCASVFWKGTVFSLHKCVSFITALHLFKRVVKKQTAVSLKHNMRTINSGLANTLLKRQWNAPG